MTHRDAGTELTQVTRAASARARALAACVLIFGSMLLYAGAAHAEPVPGIDCDQYPLLCDPDGGRVAINSVAEMAPQADAPVDSTNGADTAAESVVTDEEAIATASDADGADSVVTGVANALQDGGAVNLFVENPAPIPVVEYGAAAFGVGFAIGTAGRWLVGKLFGGSDPVQQTQWTNERWVYVPAGTIPPTPTPAERQGLGDAFSGPPGGTIMGWSSCAGHPSCYSAGPNVTTPSDGYVFEYDRPNTYAIYPVAQGYYQGSSWPYCPDGPRPPQLGTEVDGFAEFNCNGQQVAFRFATAGDLQNHTTPLTIAPTVPDGYTQTPPPTTPSRSQLAAGLGRAINQHPDYGKWLQHELDPRCHADPTAGTMVPVPAILADETVVDYQACLQTLGLESEVTEQAATDLSTGDGDVTETLPESGEIVEPGTTVKVAANPPTNTVSQEDPRCDPNGGTGATGDPGEPPPDGTGYPAYQLVQGSPYPAVTDPSGSTPPQLDMPLRWGTTNWGWRHILLKHPFTTLDQQQTQEALASDSNPVPRFASTNQWDFHLFFTMPDGLGDGGTVQCVRTVRVEYYQDPKAQKAGVLGIRGVQNSFAGLYLGGIAGH